MVAVVHSVTGLSHQVLRVGDHPGFAGWQIQASHRDASRQNLFHNSAVPAPGDLRTRTGIDGDELMLSDANGVLDSGGESGAKCFAGRRQAHKAPGLVAFHDRSELKIQGLRLLTNADTKGPPATPAGVSS